MKITKFGHACLVLEHNGSRLIVDPGNYTEPMGAIEAVSGVVVTHIHEDHCSQEQIAAIMHKNPDAKIYGPAEVAAKLSKFEVTTVFHGDHYELEHFQLDFFGDLHQEIHRSLPLVQNTAVMVNNQLFYPGDSYTQCDFPVDMLACPASAPWLKIGDVMDYLEQVKPKRCFATHNALHSSLGNDLYNSRIQAVTAAHGGEFRHLEVGQSWQL